MESLIPWFDRNGFITKDGWDIASGKIIHNSPLQLFPFQRDILSHVFTPDANGKFPYTDIIYSAPKKSGKTTIGALILAWAAECGLPGSEIYTIANDKDQAEARAFTDLEYHTTARFGIVSGRYRITFENGTFVLAIAKHYSSASGARPLLSLFDELWAYCEPPFTKVLREDLRWVPMSDLKVGDKVVSFDEEKRGGRNNCRAFRTGTVLSTGRKILPSMKITLENGKVLHCTPNHKWLVQRTPGQTNAWWEAQQLRPGDRLMRVMDEWEDDNSYEAGYLAAAFDGEGSLVSHHREGWRLDFAQRDNAMRRQVQEYLTLKGFSYWDAGREGSCKNLGMAHKQTVCKFLGSIRPVRLLGKVNIDNLGRMTGLEYVPVVSVEYEPDQEMVTLSIDAKTYLAEGYASHNTSETGRRMWAEMTPPPTVENAMRVTVTYAGFMNESEQLLDMYNLCFEERDGSYVRGEDVPELKHIVDTWGRPVCRRNGRTFIYWDTVARFPWQTKEYYQDQLTTLRPADFMRLHRNRWVSSSESFLPIELYEKCESKELSPLTIDPTSQFRAFPICLGVDIGLKHDTMAVVGSYYDFKRKKCVIAFHRIWLPPPGGMLDIELTSELFITEIFKRFNVFAILYDPSQFQRSATTLHKLGMPLVEFGQTAANMTAATSTLYELISSQKLEVYLSDELKDHLRYASAETTARGSRLMKGKHSKFPIDAAVAMAMSVYWAVKFGGIDVSNEITISSPFSDVSIPMPDPSQAFLPEALRS